MIRIIYLIVLTFSFLANASSGKQLWEHRLDRIFEEGGTTYLYTKRNTIDASALPNGYSWNCLPVGFEGVKRCVAVAMPSRNKELTPGTSESLPMPTVQAPNVIPSDNKNVDDGETSAPEIPQIIDPNEDLSPQEVTVEHFEPVPMEPNVPEDKRKIFGPVAPKEVIEHPLFSGEGYTISLEEDQSGHYVFFAGELSEGSGLAIATWMQKIEKNLPNAKRLVMHSPGGLVKEAELIGKLLRKNNWTTDIKSNVECYSSCGLVFISGRDKLIESGGRVGFHRPFIPEVEDTNEMVINIIKGSYNFWHTMKQSKDLYLDFMLFYGRDSMLIIDAESAHRIKNVEVY